MPTLSVLWAKIIFGGKLRNPYFRHIISILFCFLLLKKRLALAWTGSKIGLNEKLGRFKET